MALIQVNFISECLMRTVTLNAVIPFDKIRMPGAQKKETKSFKTLYLLHGVFGNYTDWVSGTCIQRWAEDKDLAVIMPCGENHFYVDCQANGERFSEFIGRELPEKMRALFTLSEKREDTFIGGLSMGGYGAITNGLKYSETFGRIAGLSSGLILDRLESAEPELTERVFGPDFKKTIFGDPIIGSDKDYHALAKRLADSEKPLPEIYLCCGTEDDLLEANRAYARELKDLGYPVSYEEGPGGHDWEFWNTYIKKVVDWLPLEKTESIHSGHVQN